MNETTNVVRGILHPDGTLELAERLTLPAGAVEVMVWPVMREAKGESWFESLERIRAEREAAGYPFRTKEEIDADLEADRDWGEERIDAIRKQGESQRPPQLAVNAEVAILPQPRDPSQETLWQYMERTRAELEAAGNPSRTKEEIDADMDDMRDWDGKVEEVYRQAEEESRRVNPK